MVLTMMLGYAMIHLQPEAAGGVRRTKSSSHYLDFNGHKGQWYEKEEVGLK